MPIPSPPLDLPAAPPALKSRKANLPKLTTRQLRLRDNNLQRPPPEAAAAYAVAEDTLSRNIAIKSEIEPDLRSLSPELDVKQQPLLYNTAGDGGRFGGRGWLFEFREQHETSGKKSRKPYQRGEQIAPSSGLGDGMNGQILACKTAEGEEKARRRAPRRARVVQSSEQQQQQQQQHKHHHNHPQHHQLHQLQHQRRNDGVSIRDVWNCFTFCSRLQILYLLILESILRLTPLRAFDLPIALAHLSLFVVVIPALRPYLIDRTRLWPTTTYSLVRPARAIGTACRATGSTRVWNMAALALWCV